MNIQHYCGNHDEIRAWLRTPFQLGDRTIATDGHRMLSIPKEGDYPECSNDKAVDGILAMLKAAEEAQYISMPEINLPEKIKCKTCNGGGKASTTICEECGGEGTVELENGYSYYEAQCKTCDGGGDGVEIGGETDCPHCYGEGEKFPDWSGVPVLDIHISAAYLEQINKPGVEIAQDTSGTAGKLYFRAGDQIGIITGMRG